MWYNGGAANKLKEGYVMPIVEEITAAMQRCWAFWASFTDIGDFFTRIWGIIADWFTGLLG